MFDEIKKEQVGSREEALEEALKPWVDRIEHRKALIADGERQIKELKEMITEHNKVINKLNEKIRKVNNFR